MILDEKDNPVKVLKELTIILIKKSEAFRFGFFMGDVLKIHINILSVYLCTVLNTIIGRLVII